MTRLFLTLMFSFMTASAWALPNLEGTAPQFQNPGTGTTVALQCGTNPNRFVHVAVVVNGVTQSMTGITYNAVSLTESVTKVTAGATLTVQDFYLGNAASGSNTLSMTMSASAAWAIVAGCWSGVNPVTPIGTPVTNTASAQSVTSPSLVIPAGGMAVDSFGQDDQANACPSGSNQTQVISGGQVTSIERVQSSYKTLSGSQTMSWGTCTNFDNLGIIAVPVNPVLSSRGRPFLFP